jgi:hypothetical protein
MGTDHFDHGQRLQHPAVLDFFWFFFDTVLNKMSYIADTSAKYCLITGSRCLTTVSNSARASSSGRPSRAALRHLWIVAAVIRGSALLPGFWYPCSLSRFAAQESASVAVAHF